MPNKMAAELLARFPWLEDDEDEDVSGADTVQELTEWYAELKAGPDDRECTCDDRSWYGTEHDSQCDFAGEERS